MTPSDALATRKGAAKRSQGHVQAGLLSREIRWFGVPTSWEWRKATSLVALSRAASGPRAVEEPEHARNLHAREPGGPRIARPCDQRAGRSGKAEVARLRCTIPGSQTGPYYLRSR